MEETSTTLGSNRPFWYKCYNCNGLSFLYLQVPEPLVI